jgi:hypothetical protein
MPRKFIDVYDLQDHTNEMKTEIVPEIVKEVGGTGGSGTATNIADWAEKDNKDTIPVEKTNIADWAVKDSTATIPASTKCEVPTDAQEMFSETSTLGDLFESLSSSYTTFEGALKECVTKDALNSYVTTEALNTTVNTLNTDVAALTTEVNTKANSADVKDITSSISDIGTRVTALESSSGSDEGVTVYYYDGDTAQGEALTSPNTSLSYNTNDTTYLDTNALSLIMGGQALCINDSNAFSCSGTMRSSGQSYNYVFKAKILSYELKSTEKVKKDGTETVLKTLYTYNLKIRLWYFDLTTEGLTIGDPDAEAVSLAEALTIKSRDVTTTYTVTQKYN